MSRRFGLLLLGALALFVSSVPALNLHEWSAVAPIVIAGDVIGDAGKFVEIRVAESVRGDLVSGDIIRVDVRRSNRNRNREVDVAPLRLDIGASYLVLLSPRRPRRDGTVNYDLVRGIRGARELPDEGAEAVLTALRRFVRVQDQNDDRVVWQEMERFLEDTNPVVIEVTLSQFLKFRRGDDRVLLSVRPLLSHPSEIARERAARLIAQILEDEPVALEERVAMQGELASRARRDPSVAVRVAATVALDRLDSESAKTVIREIAESDPSQSVRYTAEKLMSERRQEADPERPSN